MSIGTEPMSVDPLAALDSEYGAEWHVWVRAAMLLIIVGLT
jgi:hypothetical protein